MVSEYFFDNKKSKSGKYFFFGPGVGGWVGVVEMGLGLSKFFYELRKNSNLIKKYKKKVCIFSGFFFFFLGGGGLWEGGGG